MAAADAELASLHSELAARNQTFREVSRHAAEALSSLDTIQAGLTERDRALAWLQSELGKRGIARAEGTDAAQRRPCTERL
jgi:hypothetical protein